MGYNRSRAARLDTKWMRYEIRCRKLGFDVAADMERRYLKRVNLNYYGTTKRPADRMLTKG